MKPIITVAELSEIYKNQDVIIADVSNGVDAYENYKYSHLENAVFVDLNKNLAAVGDPRLGGRHPLPDLKDFLTTVSNLGIHPDSRVVCYDNHFGANAAARFWWMLKAIGHQNVQVLDGGFQKAVALHFPLSEVIPNTTISKSYAVSVWQLPQVDLDDMRKAVEDPNCLILDVREEKRYNGIYEPIDAIAGHIPGALNVPYQLNLDPDGNFKQPEALAKMYQQLLGNHDNKKIIVHCGSGVTACHTLLAFDLAGMQIPSLYVGSWSEWSRNQLPC